MNWKESYSDQIENLISYSKLIYQRGLVSAAGGNISARCGRHVLITGSNIPLRAVTTEGLVLCDENGTVLDAPPHLRPSAQYVLHAHPVFSTIWSMQNQELPLYTESAKLKLVHVPLIPDGQPGSADLAEKVLTAVSHTSEDTTAFLMEAHGVLILGETMENCFHQAELLEDSAKIAVFQKLLHP